MRKSTLFVLLIIAIYSTIVFAQSAGNKVSKDDSIKSVSLAAIPIVDYDPSFGVTFGALGQIFYKLDKADTISPSSSTGVFGMYTANKTYFAAAFQRFYIKEDMWRIMLAAGLGNINFQYWQELPGIGGDFIGFTTKATFAMARVEHQFYRNLYAGIIGTYSKAKTEYGVPDFVPDSLRFDERNMNNLGIIINRDMREHQLNPYGGYNIELKTSFYRKWMNSGNDFIKYEIKYNHYFKIKNERNILATRVKAAISTGDVPFQGQSVVGQDDIRGYSSGKYRDNQVYAVQAEYRWRFYKKFGMVGFLGVATAIEKIEDLPRGELLPGFGVGFRYMMIEKERINIGVDVAVGKDDWGMYFRIGESFGR